MSKNRKEEGVIDLTGSSDEEDKALNEVSAALGSLSVSTETPKVFRNTRLLSKDDLERRRSFDLDQDALVADASGVAEVRVKHLRTLKGGRWICDEVMNFMVDDLLKSYPNGDVFMFNTFFYTSLYEGQQRYDYGRVKRWAKQTDLFSKAKIVFPINIPNQHWYIVCANMKERTVGVADSLGGGSKVAAEIILRYLRDHHKAQYGTELPGKWEAVTLGDMPRQQDGSSCGVFSYLYAKAQFSGAPVQFSQKDIAAARRQMRETITQKLHN